MGSEKTISKKSEILQTLHERSWESFYERRRHEYRISIAVWTLYALSIGKFLSGSISLDSRMRIGIIVIAVSILLLYILWIFGIARANLIDRRLAIFYGEKLRQIAGTPFPDDLKKGLMCHTDSFSLLLVIKAGLNWNHRTEIGVACALTGILILAQVFV